MKNLVILIGNTGDDVKMHHFEGGGCICNFPLATSETYTNKQGEKVTDTEWHNVKAFNKQAETLEKYLKKGDKIYIEGKIKTSTWEDDQGNKRYNKDIELRNFTFLTSSTNSDSGPSAPAMEEEDVAF